MRELIDRERAEGTKNPLQSFLRQFSTVRLTFCISFIYIVDATNSVLHRFRWVELQVALFISLEHPILNPMDVEMKLNELEAGTGEEITESLRKAYDAVHTYIPPAR